MLIDCKTYVFLLSSGQLAADASPPTALRAQARVHRWTCRHCRAFTRNDDALSRLLRAHPGRLPPPGS